MDQRERYHAIAKFERPGDLWLFDSFWQETLIGWVDKGGPEEILRSKTRADYFQFDFTKRTGRIKSGLVIVPYTLGNVETYIPIPPIIPQYEPTVLEEDEKTVISINQGGQTLKALKDKPQHMPMYLDHPVKDWDTWKEYKKRLDPDSPARWPKDWDAYVQQMNSGPYPVVLGVGSFFGFLREWMGMTNLLYAFYDDPALVEDMMDTMLHLELEIIKKTVKDIKIDQANFWEDMCYKSGPLISPDMFKKYMVPRYKKITELLRSSGIDIIFVDSDGNVEKLIPLWLEAGINYIWPMEAAAGNDPVAIRKEYGKDLIIGGGIDKRALLGDKKEIEDEVNSKVPFLLESGGYFPSMDHLVPPDISLENYQHYVNCLRDIAGMDKIDF